MDTKSIHNDFDFCFCCGFPRTRRLDRKLEAAHLCKQSMGMKRPDDRRAVVLLCAMCHVRQENPTPEPVMVSGQMLPPITGGNMVWLKRQFDPQFFDLTYIDELFGTRNMGKIAPPDPLFASLAKVEMRKGRQ